MTKQDLGKLESQVECALIKFLKLNQFDRSISQMKVLAPLSVLRPKELRILIKA